MPPRNWTVYTTLDNEPGRRPGEGATFNAPVGLGSEPKRATDESFLIRTFNVSQAGTNVQGQCKDKLPIQALKNTIPNARVVGTTSFNAFGQDATHESGYHSWELQVLDEVREATIAFAECLPRRNAPLLKHKKKSDNLRSTYTQDDTSEASFDENAEMGHEDKSEQGVDDDAHSVDFEIHIFDLQSDAWLTWSFPEETEG